MKSSRNWSLPAALAALVAGSAFAAPVKPAVKATPTTASKPSPKVTLPAGVIATVNGVPIRQAEVQDRMWREGGQQITDRYVNQEIVKLEAKKRGLTAPQKEVDAKFADFKKQYTGSGKTDADFDDFVKKYGRKNIEDDMSVQVLAQKIGDDEAKKATLSAIEKKQAADELDRNANQVHARHILVGVGEQFGGRTDADALKRITEAQAELKGGAKWEDVAKKYSDDPSNKDRGGDLGFFTHGQMVAPFEQAAFSMKPNDITPSPVKTSFGYHLIQVLEVKNNPVTEADRTKAVTEALDRKKTQAKAPQVWFPNVKKNYTVKTELPFERG